MAVAGVFYRSHVIHRTALWIEVGVLPYGAQLFETGPPGFTGVEVADGAIIGITCDVVYFLVVVAIIIVPALHYLQPLQRNAGYLGGTRITYRLLIGTDAVGYSLPP